MDKYRDENTSRIINFTLEIIYLLTGEDCTIVKKTSVTPNNYPHEDRGWSRSQSPNTDPPHHSPIHKDIQKILELINKMTELLTGEDVTEDLEGYKDLYKEVKMENNQALTSQDLTSSLLKFSSRTVLLNDAPSMDKYRDEITTRIINLTLRIIYLLTGEDCTIAKKTFGDDVTPSSHLHEERGWGRSQSPNTDPPHHSPIHERKKKILELTNKITELLTGEDVCFHIKEEEEDLEDHRDVYKVVIMDNDQCLTSQDGTSRRNPPETFPGPLYYQDCPEEKYNVLENHQDEDVINIKVEEEEEESMMMEDQLCVKEVKEEIPIDDTTENSNNPEGYVMLTVNKREDEDTQRSYEGNLITVNVHSRLHSPDLSCNTSNHEDSSPDQLPSVTPSTGQKVGKKFQCEECGKQFTRGLRLKRHRRIHTGEKPFSCSECGKCFTHKSNLVRHEKSHTREKPFSCSECGKSFTRKSHLVTHKTVHTGEKAFSCSECGKCFADKSNLLVHGRIHTGEKPYSCSECEKCFTYKSDLVRHLRTHTGEKPHPCSECGKCFANKTDLVLHEKIHTGETPFSCSECEKSFRCKSYLVRHVRTHTGEKPYPCLVCGKCFANKSKLVLHGRTHTGEKPYSCLECKKCFSYKSDLVRHVRIHTGKKMAV